MRDSIKWREMIHNLALRQGADRNIFLARGWKLALMCVIC